MEIRDLTIKIRETGIGDDRALALVVQSNERGDGAETETRVWRLTLGKSALDMFMALGNRFLRGDPLPLETGYRIKVETSTDDEALLPERDIQPPRGE